MKSLEQEAEKYARCARDTNEDPAQSFLAGASAALRILSEKEGREWTIIYSPESATTSVFAYRKGHDQLVNSVRVTEAAPLRARIALLEEMLSECIPFDQVEASEKLLRAQLELCKEQRNFNCTIETAGSAGIHHELIARYDLELQKKGQGDV